MLIIERTGTIGSSKSSHKEDLALIFQLGYELFVDLTILVSKLIVFTIHEGESILSWLKTMLLKFSDLSTVMENLWWEDHTQLAARINRMNR